MSGDWKENRVDKNMKDPLEKSEFADMQKMLRDALPPVDELANGGDLRPDLWPDMLRRMEQRAGPVLWRVPWFDWALLAVAGAMAILFPALIPALVYHF